MKKEKDLKVKDKIQRIILLKKNNIYNKVVEILVVTEQTVLILVNQYSALVYKKVGIKIDSRMNCLIK